MDTIIGGGGGGGGDNGDIVGGWSNLTAVVFWL